MLDDNARLWLEGERTRSGILPNLTIGNANFSGSGLNWEMVLVIGFVGGFLERLVPDLLEKKDPRGNGGKTPVGVVRPSDDSWKKKDGR